MALQKIKSPCKDKVVEALCKLFEKEYSNFEPALFTALANGKDVGKVKAMLKVLEPNNNQKIFSPKPGETYRVRFLTESW